jgi:hypothetical protein
MTYKKTREGTIMKPVTILTTMLLIAGTASIPVLAQPTADGKAANGPAGSGAGGGTDVRPKGETGASATTQTHEESGGTAKGTKVAPTGPANAMKPHSGSTNSTGAHN